MIYNNSQNQPISNILSKVRFISPIPHSIESGLAREMMDCLLDLWIRSATPQENRQEAARRIHDFWDHYTYNQLKVIPANLRSLGKVANFKIKRNPLEKISSIVSRQN